MNYKKIQTKDSKNIYDIHVHVLLILYQTMQQSNRLIADGGDNYAFSDGIQVVFLDEVISRIRSNGSLANNFTYLRLATSRYRFKSINVTTVLALFSTRLALEFILNIQPHDLIHSHS